MDSSGKEIFPINRENRIQEHLDLYRIQNHLALKGEGPERFLATKVPVRKNKDYRPKFRNYQLGYPVYKKDNYLRHWDNFLDVIYDNEAPATRYTKFFLKTFLFALPTLYVFRMNGKNASKLNQHMISMKGDYLYPNLLTKSISYFKPILPACSLIATVLTGHYIIRDYLM